MPDPDISLPFQGVFRYATRQGLHSRHEKTGSVPLNTAAGITRPLAFYDRFYFIACSDR